MIGVDALDLDKLEWNDDKGFGGSKNFSETRIIYSLLVYDSYPAAQPVMMESCWFIFVSPDSLRKVLPQKSFEALQRGQPQSTKRKRNPEAYNFVARLGASSNKGGTRPEYSTQPRKLLRSRHKIRAREKLDLGIIVQTYKSKHKTQKIHEGSTVHAPFLGDDGPEASNKLHTTGVSTVSPLGTGYMR